MKLILGYITAAALILGAADGVSAKRETVDRIVAVVGDKVILASELANQMQVYSLQSGRQPKTEEDIENLKKEVLDQMVSDQLFLVAAEQDTMINVTDQDVDRALDNHVARVASNFDSNTQFEAALAAEGLTIRDLKKRYRDDIRGQLLKQRLISRRLQDVSISRQEVVEFYNQFQDSIPAQPEAVKLAHILLEITPSQEVEDSVKEYAADLRRQALSGADFAAISAAHSSSGAGANGGDLGWMSADDVVPEFARAAFALQPGDISGVIRTQFGYHVIKCEGVRENRSKLRHILLAVPPTREDSIRAGQLADSLLTEARNGADFAQLAKAFSADNNSRAKGGSLGWFAVDELPAEFASEVEGWTTPGEYRGPVISEFGIHILKLEDYNAERQYSLEEDFDELKEIARQEKTARMIDEWIEEIEEKTYIDYRLEP